MSGSSIFFDVISIQEKPAGSSIAFDVVGEQLFTIISSTPYHFIDPVADGPGVGTLFHFLDPAEIVNNSTPFHFDSPGFQKVGSYIRVKSIDVDAPLQILSMTVAELPNPIGFFGHIVFVTDEAGGPVLAFSDNLSWRRWTDRAIVS